jgi:putative FmdB family regulatory protein
MPMRRHECETCGFCYRVLELGSGPHSAVCPACGSPRSRRLLPRVAVQFKGSGYYKTDHARSGSRDGAVSEEKAPISASVPSEATDA